MTQKQSMSHQDDIPRDMKPQSALVNFDGFANMQNLIDAWRKRLCFKATPDARRLAEDFVIELKNAGFPIESSVLVPNCIYRCGCPEFAPCGYFEEFVEFCKSQNINILDLKERYKAFNTWRQK